MDSRSGTTAGGGSVDPITDPGAPPFDVYSRECPSRVTLEHVTGRWGALTLVALRDGPVRFNDLRRRVDGVSQKVLAHTLHDLERDGLVERAVISTFPLRVEYSLTSGGRHIAGRLVELVRELEKHMPVIMRAQADYDSRGTAVG